jgi:hypothetical protein
MRLSVGQGDRDIGRRCERGKVQRHQAEAVGFKADGMPEWVIVTAAFGWQGAATPRAIIAASVASALTSRPQGRPKGLSSAVASASATGAPGSGRAVDGLKAAGRMSAASRSDGRQGDNHGRVGEPGCFGQIDRSRPANASGGFVGVLRLQNGGKGGGRLHARCGGRRAHAEGCGPPREVFGPESRPGSTPACAAKSAIAPPIRAKRADAHHQFLLRHDDRTSAI